MAEPYSGNGGALLKPDLEGRIAHASDPALQSPAGWLQQLYKRPRVNVHANALLGALPAIFGAAGPLSSYLEQHGLDKWAISAAATMADRAVRLGVQVGMHYLAYRDEYRHDGGFHGRPFLYNAWSLVYTQWPGMALHAGLSTPLQTMLEYAGMPAGEASTCARAPLFIFTRACHEIMLISRHWYRGTGPKTEGQARPGPAPP